MIGLSLPHQCLVCSKVHGHEGAMPRCRAQAAAAAPFSPSSSALSLPSTAAEEAYGDPGDPSSSAQARGGGFTGAPLL